MPAWTARARALKREVVALYLACRDPRVPWYAKALAAVVVAYALSPIDLIPDFVPVLGYVDDLLLVPLGVLAVRWTIPPAILDDCRRRAALLREEPTSWMGMVIVAALWLLCAVLVAAWWRRSN
jgi:uncharacterized membrane protein YkvA (DUF1232 family)